MTNRRSMYRWSPLRRLAAALAVLTAACAAPPPGTAQDFNAALRFGETVAMGREALQNGDFAAADARFQEALELAEIWGEESAVAQGYFMLGLTKQSEAEVGTTPDQGASLQTAVAYYDRALEMSPGSAAVMNNLARAHAARGDTAKALEYYARAVSASEGRRALYLANYARLLAAHGDEPRAAAAYRRLIEVAPDDAPAHRYLAAYYLETAPAGLVPYLWRAVELGQVLTAERTALRGLQAPEPADPEGLLTIVAASRSRQSYAPSTFSESEAGANLKRLARDPASPTAAGASGLLDLHEAPAPGIGAAWWAERGSIDADPKVGMWPRDAFRELSRSIGAWYQRQSDFERAEAYYRLAADLVPEEVDPNALRDLTHAYLEQGAIARVPELAAEYEDRLFSGKAAAYRNTQLGRIYDFHRTLGEIYWQLGQYGDRSTVNSAVFQLEHAREAADLLQEERGTAYDERGRLLFGPDLADLLAQAYEETGDADDGKRVRLDAAERYESVGETGAARRVLRPIDATQLEAEDRGRYQDIQSKVAVPEAGAAMRQNLAVAEEAPEAAPVAAPAAEARAAADLRAAQLAPAVAQLPAASIQVNRRTRFGSLSLEASDLSSEEAEGLFAWLADHLDAKRVGRDAPMPDKTVAGVVKSIRFDGRTGTLELIGLRAPTTVRFATAVRTDTPIRPFQEPADPP